MRSSKVIKLKFFEARIIFMHGGIKRCNSILNNLFPDIGTSVLTDDADGLTTTLKSEEGPAIYLLWVRRKKLDLLAHEAIHVASSILSDRGIEPNQTLAYEETLAYTVQNILRLTEEDDDGE